jgi:hypothetical protein
MKRKTILAGNARRMASVQLGVTLCLANPLLGCHHNSETEDESSGSGDQSQDASNSDGSTSDENTDVTQDASDDDSEASDSQSETATPSDDSGDPSLGACSDPDSKGCYFIDLLFVLDNSGSMAEEQRNLAKNFRYLVEKLNGLTDSKGKVLPVSLNIMFTNSDMGHVACKQDPALGLSPPAMGMPVANTCLERLPDFVFQNIDGDLNAQEICHDFCPSTDFSPDGSSILHWELSGSNIQHDNGIFQSSDEAMDALAHSMACLGLQGIAGCGYESTLESMYQALNPTAAHNQGKSPFLRDNSTLVIVMLSDEDDCSPVSPDGYYHWSGDLTQNQNHKYWAQHPDLGYRTSSAICWNGGTDCVDNDGDGVYESCTSADKNVLHPISRYTKLLNEYFGHLGLKKNVAMLSILGVPPVTKHDEETHIPIEGGVLDLVYRKHWRQEDIPIGVADSPEMLDFSFGIGMGCKNDTNGYATPPVRIKEVCESLNYEEGDKQRIRCCIESICDDDFSDAINCLAGIIQSPDGLD